MTCYQASLHLHIFFEPFCAASSHKAVTIVAFLFFLFSVKKRWSFQKLVSTRKVQKRQRNLSCALWGVSLLCGFSFLWNPNKTLCGEDGTFCLWQGDSYVRWREFVLCLFYVL